MQLVAALSFGPGYELELSHMFVRIKHVDDADGSSVCSVVVRQFQLHI